MEQPDINLLIHLFYKKRLQSTEIVEILCGIIKQQMLYGGTLDDKLNYWFGQYKE
jgi:hypothetical protein